MDVAKLVLKLLTESNFVRGDSHVEVPHLDIGVNHEHILIRECEINPLYLRPEDATEFLG